jgi:hypothetical protein
MIIALSVYALLIVIGLLLIILPFIGLIAIYHMLNDRVNK